MQATSCSVHGERSVYSKFKVLFAIAMTLAIMTGTLLHAQQSDGTITGLVVDAKDAVVPGAKVTVSSNDGTFKTETVTGQSGIYTVPSLPPGNYAVHIERKGFQAEDILQVPVTVGGVATADAKLKVGSAGETVTVTDSTLLTSGSSTLTTTVDQDMTVDLPFAERTTLGVAMFAPGVTGEPGASDGVGSELPNAYTGPIDPGAGLAIAGSRPGSVSQLIDGQDVLLMSYPRAGITFSGDAIRSVTIASAGMPAQYGRAGGGIINQASAGGTDRYHGALRWRHRDPLFEVVQPGSGAAPPAEHLNLFTIAAGGPIPLPFWKHHMYFLAAVEPLRDTNILYGRERFLTPDEIAGRFYNSYDELNTTILKSQGYAAAVAAPRTGGQFLQFYKNAQGFPCGSLTQGGQCNLYGTTMPANLGHFANISQAVQFPNDDLSALQAQNPISQFLFNSLPTPGSSTLARFDNPQATYATDGYNGYGGRGVLVIDNRYSIRIDVNPTDRDRIYVRYTSVPVSGHRYDYHGLNSVLNNIAGESVHSENAAINYVRLLSNNVVNEARATFLIANDFTYPTAVAASKDWNAAIGLPPTLAGVGFASFAFGNNVLQDSETAAGNVINENYGVGDDLSIQKGKHTIKLGLNYRALQLNQANRNSQYGGAFGSTNGLDGGTSSTGAPLTGSATAAYILGEFSTYTIAAPKTYYYRWKYGAAYVQDDWRVLPRLTLNIGLRYNIETPRMEKYDYQGSFTPNGAGTVTATTNGITSNYGVTGGFAFSGTNGLPHTLWPINYLGFEPRLGFAYQPNHFMTVRAGYILVHPPLTGLGVNIVPNLTSADSLNTGLNGVGGQNGNYYVNLISNPIAAAPNPGVPIRSNALIESYNGTAYLPYVRDQSRSVPYAQIRSLSLQFQLSKGTLIETDYVGNKGTHLYSAPVPTNDVPIGSPTTPNTVLWDVATHQVLNVAANVSPVIGGTSITDCCGASTTLLQKQRPYPQFNGNPIYSAFDRYAGSNYNAFYVTGRQQAAFGLTFIASFSWSKSLDDGSSSNGGPGDVAADSYGFANPQGYTTKGDYSLSTYDIPLHLSTGYVWRIPAGRGQHFFGNSPRWMDEIIGGWTTSGTQIFQSGYPLFIIGSSSGTTTGFFCSTAADGAAGSKLPTPCGNGGALNDVYIRPDRVLGVKPIKPNWKRDPTGLTPTGGYLNPAAFTFPGSIDPTTNYAIPQFGTARRTYGDIRNPRIIYWNASLRKHFNLIPQKLNLEFFADIPNILNHGNYLLIGNQYSHQGLVTNTLAVQSNGLYGYTANPSFGDTDGSGATRAINLGVALTF
jgi:hypothetical protein